VHFHSISESLEYFTYGKALRNLRNSCEWGGMNLAASVRNWGKGEDFRGSHKACAETGARERMETIEVSGLSTDSQRSSQQQALWVLKI
jgi:hypothetical protein